jgi:hypothetical protein
MAQRDVSANAEVTELGFLRAQADFDIAQTFGKDQARERLHFFYQGSDHSSERTSLFRELARWFVILFKAHICANRLGNYSANIPPMTD